MDHLSAFLHTPAWERFQRAAGASVEREGGELYVKREVPRGTYWQSSRCAIGAGWGIPDFAKEAWFLRLEPDTVESYAALSSYAETKKLQLLPTSAYQPRQTVVVRLDELEKVAARLKSKHRYNIRVAEKHGVEVEIFHENLEEHLPRFWNLLVETAGRQNFRTHSEAYYRHQLVELEKNGMAHILVASHEGRDLASMVLITCGGVATYLHGASTFARKELMAPHLLHWHAMKYALEAGCDSYDLWGTHAVRDDQGDWVPLDGHASAGTTRFKLGFGGEVVEYPGTYDLVLRKVPYTLYTRIRSIRSRKRAFA